MYILFANFDLLGNVIYVMLIISFFLFLMMTLTLTHGLGTQFLNVWFDVHSEHPSLVLLNNEKKKIQ